MDYISRKQLGHFEVHVMPARRDMDLGRVELGMDKGIVVARIIVERNFDSVHTERTIPPESDQAVAWRLEFDIHPAESESRRGDGLDEFLERAVICFAPELAEPDVLFAFDDDFII